MADGSYCGLSAALQTDIWLPPCQAMDRTSVWPKGQFESDPVYYAKI